MSNELKDNTGIVESVEIVEEEFCGGVAAETPLPSGGTSRLQRRTLSRKQKKMLFYIAVLAYPVIQTLIFYFYTNFNSILLAFQKHEIVDGVYNVTFAGFDNFATGFKMLAERTFMIKNSLILYALNLGVGMTLALIFSFYIYKKYRGAKIFQFVLFAPQLISGVVFAMLFKYIVGDVYMTLFEKDIGLLSNLDTRFGTVLFYNLWIGFGTNVVLFSGSMSGIDESVVEAAEMDGANIVQEFIHVTIPMIFPTFVSFVVIGMVGVFTNQMSLYVLFGNTGMDIGTLGYYLYVEASLSDVYLPPSSTRATYSQLAAFGLILTAIIAPIVITTKKLLTKYGPSAD